MLRLDDMRERDFAGKDIHTVKEGEGNDGFFK